jgi:hypothetical protein
MMSNVKCQLSTTARVNYFSPKAQRACRLNTNDRAVLRSSINTFIMLVKEIISEAVSSLAPGAIVPLFTADSLSSQQKKQYIDIGAGSPFLETVTQKFRNFDTSESIYLLNLGIVTSYLEQIMTRCSDALSEMQSVNQLLYRGGSGKYKAYRGRSALKRAPVDTDPRDQKIMDSFLKQAGFQALRSNSIFTTGSRQQAQLYGFPFYIFPVNGYHITWNEKIYDLYTDKASRVDKLLKWIYKSLESEYPDINVFTQAATSGKLKSTRESAEKLGFRQGQLGKAISSKKEIYLQGEYYAISEKDKLFTFLIQQVLSGKY